MYQRQNWDIYDAVKIYETEEIQSLSVQVFRKIHIIYNKFHKTYMLLRKS